MTMISKFTNEYGVQFSGAVNYGLGGCSISSVSGKNNIFFKLIPIFQI